MTAHARSQTTAFRPLAPRRAGSPGAAAPSNSEQVSALDASTTEAGADGALWDTIDAELGSTSAPTPPAAPDAPPGDRPGVSKRHWGTRGLARSKGPDREALLRAAAIAEKKHERGDYGPRPLDPARLDVVANDYYGAYRAWREKQAAYRAAQDEERRAAQALMDRRDAANRAQSEVTAAETALRGARDQQGRDDAAAAEAVTVARTKLEAAQAQEAAALAPYEEARKKREEVEARTTDAKTKVLREAARLDLPTFRDAEDGARATLQPATKQREQAETALDGATDNERTVRKNGTDAVEEAEGKLTTAKNTRDTAKSNENAAETELDEKRKDTKKKQKEAKNPWFNPTRVERTKTDDEVSASGVRIGGRDRVRVSAKVERNKKEFDKDLKTSFRSGSAITTEKGFKGDIPQTHKARASGLEAGAGPGADGVFFESTRGKNETAANGQAFLADAGARAGAVAKGGDWARGDTLGVHAQAKARAAAAGASASANAAANGGTAHGGIDPITGQRRGMLGAEAVIDADLRVLEVGASADAQASVTGTRAQASVEGAADATLARVSGGISGKAGVELGGWKLAGVQGDASGSAAVTARGSASAGAQVGLTGIKAKAAGEAMIGAEAQGQAQARATLVGIDQGIGASGRAMAGAEASGEVGGGLDLAGGDAFVKAQGEAFAGAKAEGSVQMGFGMGDMDLVTLSLHGSALAGAGIGGTFLAGMVDGAFEFFAEASAALGVGLGGGFGLNVGVFVPVKYALQLLHDNGVVSKDPNDWIPQMVELGKTGKVLRSQQQGTDGWGDPDATDAAGGKRSRRPTAPDTAPDLSASIQGGPALTLAAPDLAAPPPEQERAARYAEPAGASEGLFGQDEAPFSRTGLAMLAKPGAFDLDDVRDVADADAGFGDLADEIAHTRAVLHKEMAPLADLEERWLEGFNDEAGDLVDGLAGPLQGLWSLIDASLTGLSALLSGNLGGVLEAGQGLIAGAGELIAGGWALLGQAFTDPIGAIRSFFAKFDGLRAGAELVFGGLLSGMGSMTDLFEGRIGPARALSGMIRGMAEGILDILVDHGHEAADDVRAVGDKADAVLGDPVDREALPGVTLELDDQARDAIDEDANRIEAIGGEASGRVLGAVDQAADHVDTTIAEAISYATGLVTEAIGGARRAFEGIRDAVVSQITNAQSSLMVRAAQMVAERTWI
jgi:hypothetical protein